MVKNSFLFQLNYMQLYKVEEKLRKRKIPFHLFIWTGTSITKNAKYFLWYEIGTEPNFFGTVDFLNKSKDEYLYAIDINKERNQIPNIKDIFKVINL